MWIEWHLLLIALTNVHSQVVTQERFLVWSIKLFHFIIILLDNQRHWVFGRSAMGRKELWEEKAAQAFCPFLGARPPVNNINSSTNKVFSRTAPGCRWFHGTRQSRHSCPPAHSWASHSPHCSVWDLPTINMWHMSLTRQERDSLYTTGGGWHYGSIFAPRPSPPQPAYTPFSQYWVAGVKGGPRNLITVTVGLFWHCSWSCADTHSAVCWL